MTAHKDAFTRFLQHHPQRLHVAAHSHHPWPDVSFDAHQQAWLDAAAHHDDKWDVVFGEVLPEAQRHVAQRLGLPDPTTVAFAPSTHALLLRLLSCLPRPARVLTTDAEFHSFDRQIRRFEEEGWAVVERVAAEPFASLPDRLVDAAARGAQHLVFVSQVLFDSGWALPDLCAVVAAVPGPDTFVVIDGYHAFMALPTDLAAIERRAFYLAGGYKYAMAGEGACFLHCPPGHAPRPPDTGWFAGFGALEDHRGGPVAYAADGSRFLGATFDPSGLYRFNAVQRWLRQEGIEVTAIHRHVRALQDRLLAGLAGAGLDLGELLPPAGRGDRGHFLTFRRPDAADLQQRLRRADVVTDNRGDRLRIGFGIYHDASDVAGPAWRTAAEQVRRGLGL